MHFMHGHLLLHTITKDFELFLSIINNLKSLLVVNFSLAVYVNKRHFLKMCIRYGDGAGNTVEENFSVFSLIRMC